MATRRKTLVRRLPTRAQRKRNGIVLIDTVSGTRTTIRVQRGPRSGTFRVQVTTDSSVEVHAEEDLQPPTDR